MAVNKVEINGVVKLDLTADTVTAAKLAQGETAHDASGKLITGTMTVPQLQIVVTTNAGATVTATKGGKTVSGTADASGNCTLTIDETGTWTVTAISGSTSKSVDVAVGSTDVVLSLIDPGFANNDWSAIIAACQSGNVPDTWAVGDSKTMTINGISYQIDIIGKNHDDYADGSGKAPLTFQLHASYSVVYRMNSTATNAGGWESCLMRSTYLPAILDLMPSEVKNAIREVSKKTSVGRQSSTIATTADKLFLLSQLEVFYSSYHTAKDEGEQYAYYKNGNTTDKTVVNGSENIWWMRSPDIQESASFRTVRAGGNVSNSRATSQLGVSFAFCF